MLLGSNKGQMYEFLIEDGKEKVFKKVYDLDNEQKENPPISMSPSLPLSLCLFPSSCVGR
jgi:hypothetical protein